MLQIPSHHQIKKVWDNHMETFVACELRTLNFSESLSDPTEMVSNVPLILDHCDFIIVACCRCYFPVNKEIEGTQVCSLVQKVCTIVLTNVCHQLI